MAHLTDQQAAARLGMPVRMLNKLPIHRCPEGYDPSVIDRYARRHRIPGAAGDILEVGDDVASWEEGLWRADDATTALIGPNPPQSVYVAVRGDDPRPLIISIGDSRHADWCAESRQDAYTNLEELDAPDPTTDR